MMNKAWWLFGWFLVWSVALSAQTVTGTVRDEAGSPLAYAYVSAREPGSTLLVAFTQTADDGSYRLELERAGEWMLEYSLMSYEKDSVALSLRQGEVRIHNAVLRPAAWMLQEVVIRPQVPVFMKKDTVVFNAKAFLRGHERVVEDLLKNLPGIEVDDNGVIRAQGKEVEKVLLEGDDLLNKGYQLLTKGLDVKAISQVELLQNYVDNPLEKGLVHTDDVALNLRLEDDAKGQWIGTLYGGGGTERGYNAQGNLLHVSKKNKHYLSASLNNIGSQMVANIARVLELDNPQSFNLRPTTVQGNLPGVSLKRGNFNQEKTFSYSTVLNPTENLKVEPAVAWASDRRKTDYATDRTYTWNKYSFTNRFEKQTTTRPDNYVGRLKVTYTPQKKVEWKSTTQVLIERSEADAATLFDGNRYREQADNRQTFVAQRLSYSNRAAENRLWEAAVSWVYGRAPQQYGVDSLTTESEIPTDRFEQQTTDRRMRLTGGVSYLHALNPHHSLRTNVMFHWDQDRFGLAAFDTLQLTETSLALSLFYTWKLRKARLETGAQLEWLRTDYNGLLRNDVLLQPVASWEWMPGRKHNLKVQWTFRRQTPDLHEWLPWTVRGSLNAYQRGSGNTRLLSDQVMSLSYKYGGWSDLFVGNVFLTYVHSPRYLSVQQDIHPEYILTETLPLEGRDAFTASGSTDFYLNSLSSNLKLSGGVGVSSYDYVRVDAGKLPYNNVSYRVGLQLKSSFQGAFNYDLGGNYLHRRNRSANTRVAAVTAFANLYVQAGRWRAQAHGDLCRWTGDGSSADTYAFVDMEVSYEVWRNRLTLFVRGENLLGADTYVEESFDETSHTYGVYRLHPRRVMFLAMFRF